MRALLLSEYKKLSVVEMPVPTIAEDDVLVRVKACGVCGSDIHGYDGSTGRRIPPLVMGHEAAGVIERVGSRVTGFAAGDREGTGSPDHSTTGRAPLGFRAARCATRRLDAPSVAP